jgi:error-prone DNA polymerase
MTERGVGAADQDEIVRQITSFALYGFPESHAASFALLAWASAYVREHHRACFLAAMLDCWPLGFYAPATLVKDAERHGVVTLPIDVQKSGWQSRIEGGAVRLALRWVDGLREAAARRIEAAAPFASTGDLAHRAELHRDELERLAEVGACASLGLRRRAALWQVSALAGGLLAGATPEGTSPLPEMSALEETFADYRASGITTGPHLLAHLRAGLRARGVLSAAELRAVPDGRWARTAGAVIVRQRPGTAKGFLFLTLEDETGTANAVVYPDLFQQHRAVLQRAGILLVEGPVQNEDGVIHVRGRRFERLDAEIERLAGARQPVDAPELPPSRDFR